MTPERYKPQRLLPNGRMSSPVPRCQCVENGEQCPSAVDTVDLCYEHFQQQCERLVPVTASSANEVKR